MEMTVAAQIFEIKLYREGREVRGAEPFLTGLDLDAAEVTVPLLNGHLLGAVLRSGGRRDEQHLYHLEAKQVDRYGKGAGQVLFRWVLPAAEDV
jgi:hypothetical protein